MCCRCDREVTGGGGTASRTSFEPLFVCCSDGQADEVQQESPWTRMFTDDIVICSGSGEKMEGNLERWRPEFRWQW